MEIAVIGGGAAGMTAALAARKCGGAVTIYEKNDRVGKKLLMTGNGKCNFTNLDFSCSYFRSDSCQDKEKQVFFDSFGVDDTLRFFEELGLLVKNKNGYLYPFCEQASAVLDLLRFACDRAGIKTLVRTEVKKLCKKGNKFFIEAKQTNGDKVDLVRIKEEAVFDRVVLACGSKAGPKGIASGSGYLLAASLGHHVITPVPALVQLRCKEVFFKQLAGVRSTCALTLYLDEKEIQKERGELQLTDYGISGIPVFQFSRYAAKALSEKRNVKVSIDFLPDFSKEEYSGIIHNRFERKKGEPAEEFFLGIANKKLLQLFFKLADLKPGEEIGESNRKKWEKVFSLLRKFDTQVTACNPFENAQVCAGGVSMGEVTKTLESTLVSGLFFAGELLDIDGRCGGYNLQWAWTSGHIAGENAVKGADV